MKYDKEIAQCQHDIDELINTRNYFTSQKQKDVVKRLDKKWVELNGKLDQLNAAQNECCKEIMLKLLKCVMQADLAYKNSIELLEAAKKYDAVFPQFEKNTEAIKQACSNTVYLVDALPMKGLSEAYANMTEELDKEYDEIVNNLVLSHFDGRVKDKGKTFNII